MDTTEILTNEPNPFGGKGSDSLSATECFWLISDKDPTNIELGYSMDMDTKAFLEFMREMMKNMMGAFMKMIPEAEDMDEEKRAKMEAKQKEKEAEMNKALDAMKFDITNSRTISYNSKTSYVTSMTTKATVEMDMIGKGRSAVVNSVYTLK